MSRNSRSVLCLQSLIWARKLAAGVNYMPKVCSINSQSPVLPLLFSTETRSCLSLSLSHPLTTWHVWVFGCIVHLFLFIDMKLAGAWHIVPSSPPSQLALSKFYAKFELTFNDLCSLHIFTFNLYTICRTLMLFLLLLLLLYVFFYGFAKIFMLKIVA